MNWSVGVTTCLVDGELRSSYQDTVNSLNEAGFARRSLNTFIDGNRGQRYGIVGNWILTAWELFLRNPKADFYAIFQDDIICCKNIKPYIEKTVSVHSKHYYNLYTSGSNFAHVNSVGIHEGWKCSNLLGRGALAIVFPRPVFMALLSSQELLAHVQSSKGTYGIDGAVQKALATQGIYEKVHYPSLVQHRDENEVPSTKRPQPGRVSPCFDPDINLMELS